MIMSGIFFFPFEWVTVTALHILSTYSKGRRSGISEGQQGVESRALQGSGWETLDEILE